MSIVETTAAQVLAHAQVSYELIPHRRTMTAREEAEVLGVSADDVAKTIVLADGDGFARVVVPASKRLDLEKARTVLGGFKRPRLLTEAELAGAYPMFELGAVAPFGGPEGDRVLVDRRVAAHPRVVLDFGTHSASVRLATSDLCMLAHAEVADLCAD